MTNSRKFTLTAVLLITVFMANTNICRAEYEYWFWDTLTEPFGAISDAGEGICHGVANCAGGFWKFVFGESKREPKQTDFRTNLPE